MIQFWKKNKEPLKMLALVGEWKLVRAEGNIVVGQEGITMVFSDDGKLTYTIHATEKNQIMNLTYEVKGNILITDQPSHPKKEKTEFKFEQDGQLVLKYGDGRIWFQRVNVV